MFFVSQHQSPIYKLIKTLPKSKSNQNYDIIYVLFKHALVA